MIHIVCQIALWDKPIDIVKNAGGKNIEKGEFCLGDQVIIKTEQGTDLARIVKIEEKDNDDLLTNDNQVANIDSSQPEKISSTPVYILVRKVNLADLEKDQKKNEAKVQALRDCKTLIKKHKLPMKLIDVVFHFDGGRITFAFSASSKIDFRELVKDLVNKFHKSIRLYQVGVRQEAEMIGDVGSCGRPLCCLHFLQKLGSVTTELIFDQQVIHRGVETLSGVCGRLKCCLLYEEELYKELVKNLPAVGSTVKTSQGEGRVLSQHILKQTLTVALPEGSTVEVAVQDIKKS